jgi:hypothetical protein
MCQQQDEPPTARYEDLMTVGVDLSTSSLEEALYRARYVPPQLSLTVGAGLGVFAIRMLRDLGSMVKGNPLAPWVNVEVDPSLGPYEWYLEANGRRVGSKGA